MHMTKFLTPEWAESVTDALNADAGFRNEVEKRRSVIRWSISDAPDGEVDYYLAVDHGKAAMELGDPASPPDLKLMCNYETMVGIISGAISGRDAFQGRRLQSDKRLITVLRYLGILHEINRVMAAMDVEY
jgi:hypothetical protein